MILDGGRGAGRARVLRGAPLPSVSRILVPVDFSASSKKALEFALYLAERTGASVEVLHVWEPPSFAGPETLGMMQFAPVPQAWDQTRGEVGREMEVFLGAARPRILATRIEAGEPSDAILRVVQEDGFDLVVMGTHGRTGLPRLLIGSVAEAVLRRATCPVMTIRVPGRSQPKDRVPL